MKTSAHLLVALLAPALAGLAQASTQGPAGEAAPNPRLAIPSAGVSFPISYTGEVWGNPTGGHRQGAVYDGLLEAGMTIDLAKAVYWQGATLTVDGLYPHGSSITRNDVRDFNVLSNIDALHNPRLYEAWLEQDMDGGKFSIRAGQLPINTEFAISSNGALYINSAFAQVPTISPNVNTAVYPIAAPGVRVKETPNDNWTVMGGVFDGDIGDLNTTNRNGLRFNLNGRDGALFLGEVAYTLNPPPAAPADGKQASTERPLSGTYKLGGFYDTAETSDNPAQRPYKGDYGFYGVVDQELWHVPGAPDQGLQAFAQGGLTPPSRNVLTYYFAGGLNYQGLIPGRDKDLAGLAVIYSRLGNGLETAQSPSPYPSHYETIIELTYQAILTGWLNVQPDLQYIFNPGGTGTQGDALVLGLRVNMSF